LRIVDARVIVCSPDRNFVTLKLRTSSGLTGIGDATLLFWAYNRLGGVHGSLADYRQGKTFLARALSLARTDLDDDCQFMPDGYYGLSKAYGELMGRMYWFKHGVENVNVRIGSCFPEPVDARMLSTWLSYDDLTRLCVLAN